MVPNLDIFVSIPKLCNYTNSRVLISNMTIVVSNSSPKITKQGFFGPKFCFFFFFEKFWSYTNSRVMISNMTIAFFKILAQKCPSNVFFVPNLDIFVCLFVCFCGEILQLDKFEDADFKYDNSFWKF